MPAGPQPGLRQVRHHRAAAFTADQRLDHRRRRPQRTSAPSGAASPSLGSAFLNALTYYGSILHIRSAAGKGISQAALLAALVVALTVALTVNRRIIIRPNVFLCLVALLALEAVSPCL